MSVAEIIGVVAFGVIGIGMLYYALYRYYKNEYRKTQEFIKHGYQPKKEE